MTHSFRRTALCSFALALAAPLPAHAYIGPGAGVGAIVVTLAFTLGLLLLLVGLIWYPAKRLFKKLSAKSQQETQPDDSALKGPVGESAASSPE